MAFISAFLRSKVEMSLKEFIMGLLVWCNNEKLTHHLELVKTGTWASRKITFSCHQKSKLSSVSNLDKAGITCEATKCA